MTHFKKYLSYRLRSTAFRTLVITFICAVPVAIYLIENISTERRLNSSCEPFTIVTALLAVILPILETYSFKQGKTLDVLFSLPVKRREIAIAHYISGALQLTFISLVMAGETFFIILIKGDGKFNLWGIIPIFFLSLFLSMLVYSFVIFIFGRGNTAGDGFVFVFAFYGAVYAIASYADTFIRSHTFLYEVLVRRNGGISLVKLLNLPLVYIYGIGILAECVEGNNSFTEFNLFTNSDMLYIFVFWVIVAVACTFGYVYLFCRYRAEMAGDISDSAFGYKLIIPAFGFTVMDSVTTFNMLGIVICLISMLIGYFIYRRSFRIKAVDVFTLCASLALLIV